MGSDRVRAEKKSSSTLIPGFKPKQFSFLQPRYQDQVETETDSFTENKQQNSSEQSNPTLPFLGHSFGRTSILPIQTKLTIGQPGDKYEQEADRVADQVMRMPEPKIQRVCPKCEEELQRQPMQEEEEEEETLQTKPLAKQITPLVQRQAEPMEEEEETLQAQSTSDQSPTLSTNLQNQIRALRGSGQPLPQSERAFFEPRFGTDFSQVRVHTDSQAAEAARAVNARAFTLGQDVVFESGQYQPRSSEEQRLLAHELTHVVQQVGESTNQAQMPTSFSSGEFQLQRTLGDGHDLTSPRFSRLLDLEAAYDDEQLIRVSSSGRGVQAIQQALYDLGYPLHNYGADGDFGSETESAVKAFQKDQVPPLTDDGKVGPLTMAALDARFSAPVLPAAAARSARWDADSPAYTCIRSILCPWSPHTINVLKTRITLKSFDSISWADEEWNGANWVPAPFTGGGYNTGTEIGVLNSSCEEMAETLYHEVLHAEQPTTHRTTRARESYAYRIGEEFSIAMGLGGRPGLRSTDVQGRQFADPTKVETFVAAEYPSVPAAGGSDEIIGKAATHGHVRVQRPDGSIYTRPAVVGEKVPGPINLVNEVAHPTGGWSCP